MGPYSVVMSSESIVFLLLLWDLQIDVYDVHENIHKNRAISEGDTSQGKSRTFQESGPLKTGLSWTVELRH